MYKLFKLEQRKTLNQSDFMQLLDTVTGSTDEQVNTASPLNFVFVPFNNHWKSLQAIESHCSSDSWNNLLLY